jgi:hypothetical protein
MGFLDNSGDIVLDAVLTDAGNAFINDVDQLINTNIKITQEQSKETLTKYFFIQ